MSNVTSPEQPRPQTRLIRLGLLLTLISLAFLSFYQFYYQQQPHYQVRAIKTAGGWGYDILDKRKLVIHQPTIPGQPGIVGFASQEQARRVGERAIEKLTQTKALPTLTNEELRQLGVKIP